MSVLDLSRDERRKAAGNPQWWRDRLLSVLPRHWRRDVRGFDNARLREALEQWEARTLGGALTDEDLCAFAQGRADECQRCAVRLHDAGALLDQLHGIADRWKVRRARGATDSATIARYADPKWWRRANHTCPAPSS